MELYQESISDHANDVVSDIGDVGSIEKVDFDKQKNKISIKYVTTSNQKVNLIVGYDKFLDWLIDNSDDFGDMFFMFTMEYLKSSEPQEELQEIVDEFGDIMGNDDLPNNATNTRVGSSNKDSETVYKQNRKRARYLYTNNLGAGMVVY